MIGSRYVSGGQIPKWTLLRRMISRGGSLYARTVLKEPIKDWTGGFNSWSRGALEKVDLDSIVSNGYTFQVEMKYRALKNGLDVQEVPITFEDRRNGESKMSAKIFAEALYTIWLIRGNYPKQRLDY